MRSLKHNQPTRLRNTRCAYCNSEFVRPDEPQKEHVIGRLFVPRGALEQQWNLHVNSCHACNQKKSELENDISAISMLHTGADTVSPDETLAIEANRKSSTTSRRTGRPVAQSFETFQVGGRLGPAEITFSLVGPPQVDEDRAFSLALYQIQAFHFFLTYDDEARSGYGWPGIFAPLGVDRRSDWGNIAMVAFSDLVSEWSLRLNAPTAKGYYRVLIKKHPVVALWSWALEQTFSRIRVLWQ